MPETYEPVARAGNHNFGQLQDSDIGGGKAAIIRKFWDFGVGKVSLNKSAKILNLRQTGPLRATQKPSGPVCQAPAIWSMSARATRFRRKRVQSIRHAGTS